MILWVKRISLTLFVIAILCISGFILSSVFSWDWDYRHTNQTASLPLLSENTPNGLVRIDTGEYEFRARVAGLDNLGPALILLHGMIQTSIAWVPLIKAAKAKGYRIVAFDQRGFSLGARPSGTEHYSVDKYIEDIIAVADSMGFEQFHLVGHDLGALVGWGFAAKYPERLLSWTVLSIPHPTVFLEDIETDTPGYIRFLRIPWVPELYLSFYGMKEAYEYYDYLFPDHERDEYITVFSEPGAFTAAFNFYRALDRTYEYEKSNPSIIKVPVFFIWGKKDFYAQWADTEQHQALVDNNYNDLELDTGHLLMQWKEEQTIEAIIAHLQKY